MSGSLTDIGDCQGSNDYSNLTDICDNDLNTPDTPNNTNPDKTCDDNYADLTDPDGLREVMLIAGFSAYQIAVANGFVGTEQEWLASLGIGSNPNFDTISGLGNNITFQAPKSSTKRTLQSKLSDILSVLDYGADNTGELDCSAAFASAASAASSGSDSGIIYVNPGQYTVLDNISGNANLTWIIKGSISGISLSDLPGNYILMGQDGSLTLSHSNIMVPNIENYEGENPPYMEGSKRLYSSGGVLKIW